MPDIFKRIFAARPSILKGRQIGHKQIARKNRIKVTNCFDKGSRDRTPTATQVARRPTTWAAATSRHFERVAHLVGC